MAIMMLGLPENMVAMNIAELMKARLLRCGFLWQDIGPYEANFKGYIGGGIHSHTKNSNRSNEPYISVHT